MPSEPAAMPDAATQTQRSTPSSLSPEPGVPRAQMAAIVSQHHDRAALPPARDRRGRRPPKQASTPATRRNGLDRRFHQRRSATLRAGAPDARRRAPSPVRSLPPAALAGTRAPAPPPRHEGARPTTEHARPPKAGARRVRCQNATRRASSPRPGVQSGLPSACCASVSHGERRWIETQHAPILPPSRWGSRRTSQRASGTQAQQHQAPRRTLGAWRSRGDEFDRQSSSPSRPPPPAGMPTALPPQDPGTDGTRETRPGSRTQLGAWHREENMDVLPV